MNKPLNAFFFHEPFTQNYWPDILDEVYKKNVYQHLLPHKKDSVCIDIGANVGLTTYYFSQHFTKVISVEPSSFHLEALYAMATQNKLSNVRIVPAAVSNIDGTTKFYHNDNQTMYSLEAIVNKKEDFEEVKTMTIETLMKEQKIDVVDLLKLDVEGSESKIVTSDSFKNVCPRIKVIAGEWHEWTDMNKGQFQHCLEELGYAFTWRRDTQAAVFEAVRL